jgi:LacI family transcriptional regulator
MTIKRKLSLARHGVVTIDDIAREAGVHPASVSRALRGVSNKVSPETRQRIQDIALRLGYRPNAVAASLRTKRTNLIGIVVPDLGNPLFGPIVQGLEHDLREQGLMCLIVQTPSSRAARRSIIEALVDRQVAGLIILSAEFDDPMLDATLELGLPTVLINRGLGERRFSCVVNDDQHSVRLVLEHLAALGHRRIAHIAGPSTSSTGRARHEAFNEIAALMKLKGTVRIADAFTRDAGLIAVRELLKRHKPTAIFAANDLIAMGVFDGLRERQIRIPAGMSVVGHNDMPFVDLIAPPLTTVHVAIDQMSRHGAQLMVDTLRTPDQEPSTWMLQPRLVVRGSTGPVEGKFKS